MLVQLHPRNYNHVMNYFHGFSPRVTAEEAVAWVLKTADKQGGAASFIATGRSGRRLMVKVRAALPQGWRGDC